MTTAGGTTMSAIATRRDADDPGLVAEVLGDGLAVCADCLARKSGIPRVEIPSVVERVRKRFRVHTPYVPCAVCRSTWRVYRVNNPDASDLRLVMVVVSNRRLCVACVASQTGIPITRVDELFAALGRVVPVTRSASSCEGCFAARDVIEVA